MTDNEWVTVTEASEKVNIPVETIRRYIRSHSVHLKVKKLHKKYYIHDESMTVIETIRTLYAGGKNIEEVEESLSASGVSMTFTIKDDNDESMTVQVTDELKLIKQALQEQQKFNKQLLEQMKKQQDYIEQSLNRRDKELMQTIRESQQARIESASTKQKGFFSKFFNK